MKTCWGLSGCRPSTMSALGDDGHSSYEEGTIMEKSQVRISRRGFLAGATAVFASSALAGCAPAGKLADTSASANAGIPDEWDREADVVCIGSGAGGSAAAWFALDGGLSAIVLEATNLPGGASAMNAGELYLGGGTAIQKQLGFEDSPENFKNFLLAHGTTGLKEELIDLYVESGPAIIDWLLGLGVQFPAKAMPYEYPAYRLFPEDGEGTFADFGLCEGGNESHPHYAAHWNPVPLMHWCAPDPNSVEEGYATYSAADGQGHDGTGYMLPIIRDVKAKGGEYLLETVASKLYADESGRVVGVRAEQGGSTINIKANKGVVVAGGNWMGDPELVKTYAPRWASMEVMPLTVPGTDGSALKMAIEVGGAVVNGDSMWASVLASMGSPTMVDCALYVDQRGTRLCSEDAYYTLSGNKCADAMNYGADSCAWIVLDQQAMDAYQRRFATGVPETIQDELHAESIEELAELMGAPALPDTVARYNRDAASGADPIYENRAASMRRLTGPFWASKITGFSVYSHGGLDIDANGQVLDGSESPIEGLFAAGRCARSTSESWYDAGTGMSCTQGLVVGRAIGQHLATL